MARRQGFFDDLMSIGLKLPWKVGLAAAVVIFVTLHAIAVYTQTLLAQTRARAWAPSFGMDSCICSPRYTSPDSRHSTPARDRYSAKPPLISMIAFGLETIYNSCLTAV
jgi:hypothetical protein